MKPLNDHQARFFAHPTRISQLEPLRGVAGYLRLHLLVVESYQAENHLLLSARLNDENDQPGRSLDAKTAEKLLLTPKTCAKDLFTIRFSVR